MAVDSLATALAALAKVGTDWSADREEQELLDFKETPDTALSAEQRAKRNMGKERKAFLGVLAETATCLANAHGGVIVVGVRNVAASREEALQGADPAHYSSDDIRLAIHRASNPPLTADVIEHEEDGAHVLLVRVPQGAVVYSTSGGLFKRRVADQCLPIDPADMRALQAARGLYDWSEEPTEFGVGDVSVSALARAADRLRRAGRIELAELAENDRAQFLADCGLLAGDRLRRAAVLLYGREHALRGTVRDWGLLLTSADSPGSEGAVILRREDTADRPILLLVDDVLARLDVLADSETIRVGAAEVAMVDYPQDVGRELVANAFAHRDWEMPGIIEVHHSPDELVFSSPGDLLPTLHPDRLLRETAQRNRLLAREIARLRIAEGAGLGFDRVWRQLAALGKSTPIIETGPHLAVTVPGGLGDKSFARFVNGAAFPGDSRLATDLDVLLVLSALRHRRTVNAKLMSPLLQRDEGAALRVLTRMHGAGLLEPTQRSARRASPDFRLTSASLAGMRGALSYRTATIGSEEGKLVAHLRRHGRISNEDVRNYLDCDVATARNRLTAMRKKGWIAFAPNSPRRGPNVEYVPTDKVDELSVE